MAELYAGDIPPDTSATESLIWARVASWRQSSGVSVAGLPDTGADWLHEFAKHQEWLSYTKVIWPKSPEATGTMDEEELAVLAEMRSANPSEEDAIWEASQTQA